MTPSLLLLSAIAILILPFLIGLWIGHPAFAAAAFFALGLTILIQQLALKRGDESGGVLTGMALASLISAVAAGAGGAAAARRRRG